MVGPKLTVMVTEYSYSTQWPVELVPSRLV